MKILIIGHKGSTGRRYHKILYEMGHKVIGYDLEEEGKSLPSCDKAIIACPTSMHDAYYHSLADGKFLNPSNILIEKPAADNHLHLDFIYCKMVCNWAFVFPDRILEPGKHKIEYDSPKTGNEGFWFDTCQLHILSNGRGSICNGKFIGWCAWIDGRPVTLTDIEASYFRMLDAWIYRPHELWNVQDLIPELSYIIRKQEIENGQK